MCSVRPYGCVGFSFLQACLVEKEWGGGLEEQDEQETGSCPGSGINEQPNMGGARLQKEGKYLSINM